MTANLSWYPMDAKAGTNLQQRQTIVTTGALSQQTPETPAPTMNLGDRVQGNNNSVWVFVKASTTVTAGNAVIWDEAFNANNATATLAVTDKGIAIAQFYVIGNGPGGIQSTLQQDAAQPGDYFWAAVQGAGLVANITATASANAPLYLVAGSPGQLSSTVATVRVAGLFAGTSGSSFSGSNTTVDVVSETPMIAFTSA
jgi:hypothetical protein